MIEFARGLVLKPRHKLTRKWPCLFLSFSDCGGISDDQKKRLPQRTNKRNVYLGLGISLRVLGYVAFVSTTWRLGDGVGSYLDEISCFVFIYENRT